MFNKARLKLTFWYLLIIMLISMTFSVAIFVIQTRELDRFDRMQRFRLEKGITNGEVFHVVFPPQPLTHLPLNPELVEEAKDRLLFALFLANIGIFLLAGGLGYLLAGRTLKPIAEMVDEQNRFIGDSSHELKTPLTSLKSAFEVYLRNKKRTVKDADIVIKESIEEVNRLQFLSESLLHLAQYQKPDALIQLENTQIVPAIKAALQITKSQAEEKNITIITDLEDATMRAEKRMIDDLFVILIDNAIKYSNDEGIIEIASETTDGHTLVVIKDNGIGIDEKDLPHVFERFYRADSARQKIDSGGYGLGLSIAKQIVEKHKGTIYITSEGKMKGTRVTIKLPIMHKESFS